MDIFGPDVSASSSILKPLETREVLSSETGPRHYKIVSDVFSPTDLGIPSQRPRQYVAMSLAPFFDLSPPMSFDDMFFRRTCLDASVYIESVPEEVRKRERFEAAASRRTSVLRVGFDGIDEVMAEDRPLVT